MYDDLIVSKTGTLSKNFQWRVCKSPVPRMTLAYTHFIFSKMSLQTRLFFYLIFREMDLVLPVLRLDFFFPPPNCFRTVFVPTSFANVLSFLRPLTTFSISGAAISNKHTPILFAAGTIKHLIKGIAVLPRVWARAPTHLLRCLACPRKIGKSAVSNHFV